MKKEKLFIEKYRPHTVDECILPNDIKSIFSGFIKSGNFPNLLLTGLSGTGKTSIAIALCKELNYDYTLINASEDRNLDMVRNGIKNFAGTMSLKGREKAIILDEADGLSSLAQEALRGSIEKYSDVRFIFTCNHRNKIIDAIQSRLSTIEFVVKETDKKILMTDLIKRIMVILKQENIEYDLNAVAEIVKRYFPDNRKILNIIQQYSHTGKIDNSILGNFGNVSEYIKGLKDNNLVQCRQWIANNQDMDSAILLDELFEDLYKTLKEDKKEDKIAPMIKIMDHYATVLPSSQNKKILLAGMTLSLIEEMDYK